MNLIAAIILSGSTMLGFNWVKYGVRKRLKMLAVSIGSTVEPQKSQA